MAETFSIKRNDTLPGLRLQLLDGEIPVDLTNAVSARLFMSNLRGVKVDGAMSILDQSAEENRGVVEYDWQDGDTDTTGTFTAEVEVMWPGQRRQTFPDKGYQKIQVTKDLGNAP
jgi:hypothetical protein